MSQVLDIEHCDLNTNSNRTSHHTDLCKDEGLIIRRGQPFTINLHLKAGSKEFDPKDVTLIVETGPSPRKESDTQVSFGVSDSIVDTAWSATATTDPSTHVVSVTINSSPEAPIGVYSLTLDTKGHQTSLAKFTLLFNAWCRRDAVYMSNEEKRNEYVLSQYGMIFVGTYKKIKRTPWLFGQFKEGILDICLKILDNNPKCVADACKDCAARGNPIYVSRVLSAMINSNDDMGVVVGKWQDYDDEGVHPSEWVSSEGILRKWTESGPVCYGQCWVFAAVSCTVSRALGIPCRVVTNFGSAHDSNADLVIEVLHGEDGESINDDSVWNFHVWVDNWMTRPDLGQEYDGWQICDPTPQEKSEGVFCCGPASLKAVREGELTKDYDVPFVFAEVNADILNYVKRKNGELFPFLESTSTVGRCISTKAVGSYDRHDITHQYKYPEGSEEERAVYEKAQHHNKLHKRGEVPGLNLKIKLADNMIVGNNFDVRAVLINNSMEEKTCSLMFFAKSVTYDGKRGQSCGFASDKVEVKSGEEKSLYLKLAYDSYGPVITSDMLIQLSAIAIDKKTHEYQKAEKTIVLQEPEIQVKLVGEVKVNQPATAELILLNSLPEQLKDCSFSVVGLELTEGKHITLRIGTVGPKQEAKASVEFTPKVAGSSMLLVKFDSNKLRNIKTFFNVVVDE